MQIYLSQKLCTAVEMLDNAISGSAASNLWKKCAEIMRKKREEKLKIKWKVVVRD